VWCVCAIAGLCVVFGVVLAAGQAVVARHRAAAAADLAALAAADRWTDGGEAACGTADRVARAQGGRLVRCAVRGEISDITATAGRGLFTAEVRARAGPPEVAVPDTQVGPAPALGSAAVDARPQPEEAVS
jgi:secretion/DNA translocation related TadE-like protein